MKRIIIILTLCIVNLFVFAGAKYVHPITGTNTVASGTFANPYKTITYAAGFLNAGDTLFLRGETYTNTNYGVIDYWKQEATGRISNRHGTSTNWIVVMPYNNEHPVIKCDGQFGLQINSCTYIKVQGIEVYGETENIPLSLAATYQFAFRRNVNLPTAYLPGLGYENRLPVGTNTDQSGLEDLSPYTIYRPFYFNTDGITVQNSQHIIIVNNLVHHMPGEGIRFASSDYFTCEANEVHNCAIISTTGVHGISCYTLQSFDNNDATKVFFKRNLVHDNYCELASWSEQKVIFTAVIDEGKGLTIQRCYTANGWDHGRILFENNVSYRNGLAGIHVNDGDRIDIVNNTVYANDRYGEGGNLGISAQGGNDIKIYNNIAVADLSWGGYTISKGNTTANVVVSNNLVNGNLDPDIDAIDVNTIIGNPLFVNGSAYNFHLQSTSPAINNALLRPTSIQAIAPTVDYDLITRDATPDRGAFEYVSTLPLSLVSFNGRVQNDKIELLWQTTSETNTHYFGIEKLINNNWVSINVVLAKGLAANYSINDNTIFEGTNYYRLKMIDKDGAFAYSKTIAIDVKQKNLVLIFPNPFVSNITIKNVSNKAVIKMIAANGRDVTNNISIKTENNQVTISADILQRGNYFIVINNQSYKITKAQ